LEYAADRNMNRNVMVQYAKQLNCDWLNTQRRKSFGEQRHPSGKKYEKIIGVSFKAPDGTTHKVIGISSDGVNVTTRANNGSTYKVPLKYVLQILIR
jgi:hypothetical protein